VGGAGVAAATRAARGTSRRRRDGVSPTHKRSASFTLPGASFFGVMSSVTCSRAPPARSTTASTTGPVAVSTFFSMSGVIPAGRDIGCAADLLGGIVERKRYKRALRGSSACTGFSKPPQTSQGRARRTRLTGRLSGWGRPHEELTMGKAPPNVLRAQTRSMARARASKAVEPAKVLVKRGKAGKSRRAPAAAPKPVASRKAAPAQPAPPVAAAAAAGKGRAGKKAAVAPAPAPALAAAAAAPAAAGAPVAAGAGPAAAALPALTGSGTRHLLRRVEDGAARRPVTLQVLGIFRCELPFLPVKTSLCAGWEGGPRCATVKPAVLLAPPSLLPGVRMPRTLTALRQTPQTFGTTRPLPSALVSCPAKPRGTTQTCSMWS
jgi:hypothetical protein